MAQINRALRERGWSARQASLEAVGAPELIRNIRRGHLPSMERMQALCEVLGLEFYIGPRRESGTVDELRLEDAVDSTERTLQAAGIELDPPTKARADRRDLRAARPETRACDRRAHQAVDRCVDEPEWKNRERRRRVRVRLKRSSRGARRRNPLRSRRGRRKKLLGHWGPRIAAIRVSGSRMVSAWRRSDSARSRASLRIVAAWRRRCSRERSSLQRENLRISGSVMIVRTTQHALQTAVTHSKSCPAV